MRALVLAALLAVGAPARAAGPVTIKLGTLAPAGSAWHEALKEMAARWEEASAGQVKLRVYAGGAQGDEGEMIRKLGIGQLQAAAVTNVGLHDVTPEPEVFSTPLLFQSEDELSCTLDRVKGPLDAALERRGLVPLQWTLVGTASLFCNAPFRTPAELARAKIFAWEGDPAMVKAFRTAGLRPVVLSANDLVPALSTHMIDCVSSAPAFMLGTRAFEKASHLIDLPIAFLTGATVVRKDVWEKIAPDVRARLLEIAHDVGARIDADAKRLESDALSAMASQGLTKVPVSADEWRPSMEKSWEVIRGEAVPAPFFDEVKAARDACRSASSAAARTPPRGAPRPPARGR